MLSKLVHTVVTEHGNCGKKSLLKNKKKKKKKNLTFKIQSSDGVKCGFAGQSNVSILFGEYVRSNNVLIRCLFKQTCL